MSFRSESNGSVAARRGILCSTLPWSCRFFIAANTIAVSVGSPICNLAVFLGHAAPSGTRGSEHKNRFTLSLHDDVIFFFRLSGRQLPKTRVILFCVRVPVLSEQITDAEPRRFHRRQAWIIALRLPSAERRSKSTIVTIAGSPSGIADTASENRGHEHLHHGDPVQYSDDKYHGTRRARAIPGIYRGTQASSEAESEPPRRIREDSLFCPSRYSFRSEHTTAVAVPYDTRSIRKSIFVLSPRGARVNRIDRVFLGRNALTRQRALLGFKAEAFDYAGIRRHEISASSLTMSRNKLRRIDPKSRVRRVSRAHEARSGFAEPRACSARFSCAVPIIAFTTTIKSIRHGSKNSDASPDMQASTNEIPAAARVSVSSRRQTVRRIAQLAIFSSFRQGGFAVFEKAAF